MAEERESSKGKITTLECMVCNYREVFTETQFKFTDGLSCYVCNGPVLPSVNRPGEKLRNRRMEKYSNPPKNNNHGSLKVKIDIDCADALIGLKAVTRAAKKATTALKELDEQLNKPSNPITVNVNSKEMARAFQRGFVPKGVPEI